MFHGGLVNQEIRGSSPPTDLSELLTGPGVSTEGNLVASLGPEGKTESVGTVNGPAEVKLGETSHLQEPLEIIWVELLHLLLRVLLQGLFVPLIVKDQSLALDMMTPSQEGLELGVVEGQEADQTICADYVERGQILPRFPHSSLSSLDDVDEPEMMVSMHVTDVNTLQTHQDFLRSLKH